MKEIDNVLIFISDSVRWDIGREYFQISGGTQPVKTVAHSTFTFTSLPSMLLGILPGRHGVYSPRHRSQYGGPTLFGLEDYHTSMALEPSQQVIQRGAFPEVNQADIKDLEPPFVHVEHDIGGHAPYGTDHTRAEEFYEAEAPTREKFLGFYEDAIERSVERLETIRGMLEDRDLADSTLLILTSDHGELVYDYGGLTGHVRPVTPELVYVPTTFIHPDISDEMIPEYINHVDIVPTVLNVLDEELEANLDGKNCFDEEYSPYPGVNRTRFFPQFLSFFGDPSIYEQESIWDENGGHVFMKNNSLIRLLAFFGDAIMTEKFAGGAWKGLHPATLRENIPLYLDSHQSFGSPDIDRNTAIEILNTQKSSPSATYGLDEETQSQLRDLGYI